jgi:RHH-type transcriptional regulator, rel operon repressor / antitoxin RelB
MRTAVLTVRVDEKTKERVEKIAKATDRPISYLLARALDQLIEEEEWQIGEIKRRVELANKPGAKFVEHSEVEAWLKTGGSKKEKKAPKCA